MKVYRISKWAFGSICFLILLLPVSRHWRLLTTGERATGTVTGYAYGMVDGQVSVSSPVEASEIEFEVDGVIHTTYGPSNYEYKRGRTVHIFYKQRDPEHNCVATFTGFYLNYYTAIPIVLLAIWYAFYLSFNNYRKQMKKPKSKSESELSQSVRKAFKNSGSLPFF